MESRGPFKPLIRMSMKTGSNNVQMFINFESTKPNNLQNEVFLRKFLKKNP